MNDTKKLSTATEIAQFRFALIAPVIQGLFPDASRTAYYKRVTEKPLTFPDGTVKEIKYKTLEKWVSNYQRYGYDALLPSERCDKGCNRRDFSSQTRLPPTKCYSDSCAAHPERIHSCNCKRLLCTTLYQEQ